MSEELSPAFAGVAIAAYTEMAPAIVAPTESGNPKPPCRDATGHPAMFTYEKLRPPVVNFQSPTETDSARALESLRVFLKQLDVTRRERTRILTAARPESQLARSVLAHLALEWGIDD